MIPLCDIHHLHDLSDWDAFIRIYGECRVFFALKELHQLILGVLKAYRTLVTIDMEGVSVVPPVFYGYADGSLGSHLPGTLRKKEFERVGIDQRGCHEEKYQEQEHNVRHGGH